MTDRQREAILARIAVLHIPERLAKPIGDYCVECGKPWPCTTYKISTETVSPTTAGTHPSGPSSAANPPP